MRGTVAGHICSFYYLKHSTMDLFTNNMHAGMDLKRLLLVLSSAPEFDELPVWLPDAEEQHLHSAWQLHSVGLYMVATRVVQERSAKH